MALLPPRQPASFSQILNDARTLTLIDAGHPQFLITLDTKFPGLSSITNFDNLRPFIAVLRNDSAYRVRAYTLEYTYHSEGDALLRSYVRFVQEYNGPSRSVGRLSFRPQEVRLLLPNTAHHAPRDFVRDRKSLLSSLSAIAAANSFQSNDYPFTTAVIDFTVYDDGAFAGTDRSNSMPRYQAIRAVERRHATTLVKYLNKSMSKSEILAALDAEIASVTHIDRSPTQDVRTIYRAAYAQTLEAHVYDAKRLLTKQGSPGLYRKAFKTSRRRREKLVATTMQPNA